MPISNKIIIIITPKAHRILQESTKIKQETSIKKMEKYPEDRNNMKKNILKNRKNI